MVRVTQKAAEYLQVLYFKGTFRYLIPNNLHHNLSCFSYSLLCTKPQVISLCVWTPPCTNLPYLFITASPQIAVFYTAYTSNPARCLIWRKFIFPSFTKKASSQQFFMWQHWTGAACRDAGDARGEVELNPTQHHELEPPYPEQSENNLWFNQNFNWSTLYLLSLCFPTT